MVLEKTFAKKVKTDAFRCPLIFKKEIICYLTKKLVQLSRFCKMWKLMICIIFNQIDCFCRYHFANSERCLATCQKFMFSRLCKGSIYGSALCRSPRQPPVARCQWRPSCLLAGNALGTTLRALSQKWGIAPNYCASQSLISTLFFKWLNLPYPISS